MNFVQALSRLIPGQPTSAVATIVASVPKSPALIAAERAFSETAAARLPLSKRRAEIFENLNIKSPHRTVFKPEEDALLAERSEIDRQVANLDARDAEIRREIAGLMPDHARAVAAALAGFRRRAAENLLDAIVSIEEAITDISETSKALSAVGVSVTSASPLAFARAYRNLAERVLTEKVQQHG